VYIRKAGMADAADDARDALPRLRCGRARPTRLVRRWVRLIKPRRARACPWRLERVVRERGDTLVLRPPPTAGFRFEPGQFGWFAIGRSPFSLTQHPFSFSSSAERDDVELAVKALGDFTSRVSELEPGTTV
jgi:predicted ferric reductase